MPSDKPNAKYKHLYAVVRIDNPVHLERPENSFTVIKVFPSRESAEIETARLNKINADKNCTYFTQITRMSVVH